MNGLLDQYKKDPKFLKIIKQMSINAEMIDDLMKELNEGFPAPSGCDYDFSIKEKVLRIILKH